MRNKVSNRLAFYRKRAGLSQSELERRIGASSGYIGHIESGRFSPTFHVRIKLAKELNCDPKDLIFLEK